MYKDIHDRWQPSKKRSINRIPNVPIHSNGNQRKWGERMRFRRVFLFGWRRECIKTYMTAGSQTKNGASTVSRKPQFTATATSPNGAKEFGFSRVFFSFFSWRRECTKTYMTAGSQTKTEHQPYHEKPPKPSNGNQPKWGERMRIQPSTFFFSAGGVSVQRRT